MDRYEFEIHSQVSTSVSSLSSPSLGTIPTIVDPAWVSLIESCLYYAYPVIIITGLFFSLLTLAALIQNVYMTSKTYLFTQTLFEIMFLSIGVCLYIPKYDPTLIPKYFNEKVYYNFLLYTLWFIIIWLFLISCLDHTCTAIQSSGYNEKLFCSPCSSKNSIIGIIFLGIIFSLPQLFAWEPDGTIYRSTQLRKSDLYEHIYFWFLHIIYLFIPLFAIFVFMGTLLYTLCRKKEHYLLTSNGSGGSGGGVSGGHYGHYTIHYANPHENSLNYAKTRERENITKMFVFMCFLYLIFVLPYSFIIFFGKLFLREQAAFTSKTIFKEIILAYDMSLLLFYLQILMKFFVLTIFSRNFRLCLKKLITCQCCCCCCCCCGSGSSTTGSNEHNHDDGIYMK